MTFIPDTLKEVLEIFASSPRKLTLLTGAGLSADSGIPTFRDKDGFWTVGSVNYMPEEMGTYKMFVAKPLEVWKWFLYRHTICSRALPNKGHYAIKELENLFQNRFRLISQNVDGLHFKAHSSRERTYLIHGSLEKSRCGKECSKELYPFPSISYEKGEELQSEYEEQLHCPRCGAYLRPHVLWFDENYDEQYYKLDSCLRTAKETGVLIVVGTSGSTTLPNVIVRKVLQRQGIIIDVNTQPNVFSELARSRRMAYALRGASSDILPEFVQLFSHWMPATNAE